MDWVVFIPGTFYYQESGISSRRTIHWILQSVASVCVLAGTVLQYINREMKHKQHIVSVHSIVGLLSMVLVIVSLYHLLMAEGIILLYSGNGWTQKLSHSHKRTVHWLIEVVGCSCCVVGIALEIYFRQSTNRRHFSSSHSIVGLISLAFLVLTLVNGLMALFASELRKRIRPIYSKLSHYLTGTVCYVLGMVAIVLAYEKKIYHQNTITEGITMMTVFTISITVLSMVGVMKTIYNQFKTLSK
uniref:ascorbate ferrireductase (transmembrane) n=1 Tax=Anopheles culicifacies TaxID=139723 RepID=A0A182LRX6_9DIPT